MLGYLPRIWPVLVSILVLLDLRALAPRLSGRRRARAQWINYGLRTLKARKLKRTSMRAMFSLSQSQCMSMVCAGMPVSVS